MGGGSGSIVMALLVHFFDFVFFSSTSKDSVGKLHLVWTLTEASCAGASRRGVVADVGVDVEMLQSLLRVYVDTFPGYEEQCSSIVNSASADRLVFLSRVSLSVSLARRTFDRTA